MRQISDRFNAAVKCCVGSEPVKQRLANAWTQELEAIGISELPRQLRGEFRRLRDAMNTAKPQPHESAANASVRKMSAKQAAAQTLRILQLSHDLQRISVQAETIVLHDQETSNYVPGANTPETLN